MKQEEFDFIQLITTKGLQVEKGKSIKTLENKYFFVIKRENNRLRKGNLQKTKFRK